MASPRSRSPLVIGIVAGVACLGALLVLVLVIVIGVVVWNESESEPGPEGSSGAGEITLRMHPRPMLDASSTPEGYSGRAANAAVFIDGEQFTGDLTAPGALEEAAA